MVFYTGFFSPKAKLMKRRDFLKAIGLSAVLVKMPSSLLTAGQSQAEHSAEQILAQSDELVEKHRMGKATLKLVGPDNKPLKTGLNITIEQIRHKFLFGCNIFKLGQCRTPEDNANYEEWFAKLLNYATLPFYWWDYERQRGKPDYERTKKVVFWCRKHNITTKGHPLAWNLAEPKWLPDAPEGAMRTQLLRIRQCVKHFRGGIDIWDVVNEATHYDRDGPKQRAPKLTRAIDRIGVGEYVRRAFRTARDANPKAMLIINDYRTGSEYREKVISQLVDTNGQPLYDAIGIQSHMHRNYWGAKRVWELCEQFAKFGKPLHFTETTIVSGPRTQQNWVTTSDGERQQAEQTAEFYRVLFSHPAVEAVTWWDFSDQGAWRSAPAGLVRTDMTPKPVYEKLMDLIKNKWWTRTKATLQANSQTQFKGFFGQYNVSVQSGNRQLTGSFWFDKTMRQTTISVQMS
jgi:endo-1,4-beta-xylanase